MNKDGIYQLFFYESSSEELLNDKKITKVLNHFKQNIKKQNNPKFEDDAWKVMMVALLFNLIKEDNLDDKSVLEKWIEEIKKIEFPAYKTEYSFLDLDIKDLENNQKYFEDFEPTKNCDIKITDPIRKKYLYTQISWYEALLNSLKIKFSDFLQDSLNKMIKLEKK